MDEAILLRIQKEAEKVRAGNNERPNVVYIGYEELESLTPWLYSLYRKNLYDIPVGERKIHGMHIFVVAEQKFMHIETVPHEALRKLLESCAI